jgi:hypothetical protein
LPHLEKESRRSVAGRALASFKQFPPASEVEGQNDHQVRTMLPTND